MKKKRRPWGGINLAIFIFTFLAISSSFSFATIIIGNVTLTDADVNPAKSAFNFTLNFNGSNLTGSSGHIMANVSNSPGHQVTLIPNGQIKFRNIGGRSFEGYNEINSVILHNFTDEWGQGYSSGSAFASYFPPYMGDAVQFIVSNGSGGWYHGLLWISNITAGQNATFLYKLNNQTNNNTFADIGACEAHTNASSCVEDFENNCEWQSTGALCKQRGEGFNHDIPPADCTMLPRSACNSINSSVCYWDANGGTYGKCTINNSGFFNFKLGFNCSNIVRNQTFCNNQAFTEKTGLCSWDTNNGKCNVNNSKTFENLQKPPVFFCEAPGYVTNRSQCENLSENYFMPCGWNNATNKCGPIFFDFEKFNNFESIGSESTCQSAGGSWRSESAYDPINGKITTESWCEFGVAVKTFGQIGGGGQSFGGGSGKLNDCSVDCFACEFAKNGSRWATSAEFQNACQSSSAGCNFRSDTNAFNGYGWCNPAAGFGGFNCNNFCGDCNLMPNASNACQTSPKGCKWDNMTNFCIEEGFKGCNQDCMQCIGQQSCQQSPANGGCNWDQSTLFCQPKGGSFEICFDGTDNDNDGSTDCKDFKCSSDPFCGGSLADTNNCFSHYGASACSAGGCAWINDTFGFQFCAPKFELCFRNETLQNSKPECETFGGGDTCLFDSQPECDENITTVNICIGYGNNDAACKADSRCNYKNFTEIFGGQGGFCDTKGVVKCEENQTLRMSQAACEAAGCVWEGNQGFDAVGFFSPCVSPCFNSSISDSTKCAGAGSSISPFGCAWKTGSCKPKNFIGGCFENDGDYSACTENTNCNWFEDTFGPVKHPNGSSDPRDFQHVNAIFLAIGLNQPVGNANESNYTLSKSGSNLTLIMTKGNVSPSGQPHNISRLWCRENGNDVLLMQYNFTNSSCDRGTCNLFANATCGNAAVNYFLNNITRQLEVLWQVPIEQLGLDTTTGDRLVTGTLDKATIKIDGNLSEGYANESATSGDGTNATRVRLSSGFCNDGLSNNFFQGMEDNPPVPIAADSDDSTYDYVDIVGLGIKKTPEAYMYGLPLDNISHSALCKNVKLGHGQVGGGTNKSKYYLYLDTDGKTTGSCSPDDNGAIFGFEYKFTYIVEVGQDNNLLETFLSQKCSSGSWAATNIPLKSEKRKACDLVGGPIFGLDKDTLTGKSDVNTSAGWRAYATATNSSGNSSSVLDTIGPGSADFKGIDVELIDCTSTSDKDNSQCSKFKQFGFFPGEFGPACKDTISGAAVDNDGDGLANCDDSDCKYDPFFCGGTFAALANDKTSPSLVWTKLNTKIPTALSIIFDTDEPSNGTVKFYGNDSKCAVLNSTLNDKALDDGDSFTNFRPHHVTEIRGLRANGTYFYKMEVCDPSGNCAVSKCSNATTAISHSNVTFKLEFPSGWSVDIPSMSLSNYSQAFALKASTEYLHDINITIKSPDNSSAITFVGVDIFEKQTLNTSEFITGSGYVGIDANQYQSFKQKTGLEETLVKIPTAGTTIEHCDEDGLNCEEVTDNVDCSFESTYTECEVPDAVGLGFSTYKASTPSPQSPGGGGGGSGGGGSSGGGGAVVELAERTSTTKFWDKLSSGQQASMLLDKIGMPLTKIAFTALNELSLVEVKIGVLAEMPLTETFISHPVYEYLSIDKKNLKETDISSAEIEFRVDSSWISQNGNGEVVLARYTNRWEELPTVQTASDFEYSHYKSTTPGFSYFAIVLKQDAQAVQYMEPVSDLPIPTGDAVAVSAEPQIADNSAGNYIEVILIAGIVLVVAAIFMSRKHRHFNP